MKGRDGNYKGSGGSSAYSADLLVCFPSRAHLALTPKPIYSPARHSSDSKNLRHVIPYHRRHVSKLAGGHASPLLWPKQSNKQMGSYSSSAAAAAGEIAEPTSPKVTCAGQIKVRPSKRAAGEGACKNWQSVMEEIEMIRNGRQQSKFLGFKRDVMGFLMCLRNIRFDFRCFGSYPHGDITTDDEEDDEENVEEEDEEEGSRTVFSKWFMVLQENQSAEDSVDAKKNPFSLKRGSCDFDPIGDENSDSEPAVPPPNALLLMRCRSAPAKSWLEEQRMSETEQEQDKEQELGSTPKRDGEGGEEDGEEDQEKKKKKDLRSLMEEEKMNVVVMRYGTEFYRLSADIAKETWVVGGIKDPLSISRSWKI